MDREIAELMPGPEEAYTRTDNVPACQPPDYPEVPAETTYGVGPFSGTAHSIEIFRRTKEAVEKELARTGGVIQDFGFRGERDPQAFAMKVSKLALSCSIKPSLKKNRRIY